jgi:hypothetical protein
LYIDNLRRRLLLLLLGHIHRTVGSRRLNLLLADLVLLLGIGGHAFSAQTAAKPADTAAHPVVTTAWMVLTY